MAWWNWVVSPVAAALGWGRDKEKKEDPFVKMQNQLQPLIDQQKEFSAYGFPAAKASFGKAESAYDTTLNFFNKFTGGPNEGLLNLFNADEITQSSDEAEGKAYSLGGRSGSRAAALAGIGESRMGALERLFANIRFQAGQQVGNIGQAYASLGANQASLATGTAAGASKDLFGIQDIVEGKEDRRAQLIASIIGTAGTVAGAAIGASDVTLKENIKPITELGDKLRKIYGVSYEWNMKAIAQGKDIGSKEAGVLAQQVESVFPDLVITEDGIKKVKYTALTALLLEALHFAHVKENSYLNKNRKEV